MDTNSADLDALIAEATVDANDDDEQLIGFHSVIEEYLAVPFEAEVLGVPVTVEQIEQTDADHLVAVCQRNGRRQNIALVDLPLPTPAPAGSEWIAAYSRWARR